MSFTATPPGSRSPHHPSPSPRAADFHLARPSTGCNPASGGNMTGKCGFGLAESDDGLRWR